MIRNYLKAFFNLAVKQKLYLAINLISLSVGLAAVLLIGIFVGNELSFERQYTNADRIYRLNYSLEDGPSGTLISKEIPGPVAPLIEQSFNEVEQVARFGIRKSILRRDDRYFYEDRLAFADSSFFKLFNLDWVEGDPETSLLEPTGIVLTQSLAKKYFGDEQPMGQTLVLDNDYSLEVTGVVRDFPGNTHLQASGIASIAMLETLMSPYGGLLDNWNLLATSTYLMLKKGEGIESLEASLPEFTRQFIPEEGEIRRELGVRKLTSIHLHPEPDGSDINSGNLTTVVVFSTIAFVVLAIAVVNFINLTIAVHAWRIKEVGIRKSAGASRTQLITQFVGEAAMISLLGMLCAAGLAEMLSSVIPYLSEIKIDTVYWSSPLLLIGFVMFSLVLGIVAGFYPALYLSSFRPIHIIKREMSQSRRNMALRNLLVLAQFSASITIVIVAVIIFGQMKHTDRMDLGFEPDEIIEISTPQSWNQNYSSLWSAFREQLIQHTDVVSVTHSMGDPLQLGNLRARIRTVGDMETRSIPIMSVGSDFFETYQIDFLSGRGFSSAMETDSFYARDAANPAVSSAGAYILNEQAVHDFGWTLDEALDKELYMGDSQLSGPVIGVVSNTVRSARETALPAVYFNPRSANYPFPGKIALRISGRNLDETLAYIDQVWRDFFPESPIVSTFINDQIDAMYQDERQMGKLFRYFAGLSIFLSCAGLFGLATFNAERRTKEIGIRKVMGGSVWSIVLLLTNDFSKLVLISNLIAWPVAYFAMSRWLENFAYRIDLSPLIFIGSGAIALCIAWVTVGGTAAKAASQKPVLALRYE